VTEEIMLQLASSENHSINQFLNLGVLYLCVREHLTDKVDGPLNW